MLLSEQEAGTRRCPHRGYMGQPEGFCLASMCMAWRWGPPVSEAVKSNGPPEDDADWTDEGGQHWHLVAHSRGFCGLAGKPGP